MAPGRRLARAERRASSAPSSFSRLPPASRVSGSGPGRTRRETTRKTRGGKTQTAVPPRARCARRSGRRDSDPAGRAAVLRRVRRREGRRDGGEQWECLGQHRAGRPRQHRGASRSIQRRKPSPRRFASGWWRERQLAQSLFFHSEVVQATPNPEFVVVPQNLGQFRMSASGFSWRSGGSASRAVDIAKGGTPEKWMCSTP